MIILPAIDIMDGKPVRLYQGDYNKKEIVGNDVLSIAKEFETLQASYIHMVDLDGAKKAQKINQNVIISVAKNIQVPVEVGGGIRTMQDVDYYLQNGVSRVILGTSAIENKEFVKEAVLKYGNRIAVGIDCKNGWVCGSGWLETSREYYLDFAKEMESLGVETLIVTDISKDGTMMGPNVELLENLKKTVHCQLVASGGIKSIEHIRQLKQFNIYGAITGKALYAHTLDLSQAIKEAQS